MEITGELSFFASVVPEMPAQCELLPNIKTTYRKESSSAY